MKILNQIDKMGRDLAASLTSMIQSSTGLQSKNAIYWIVLGVGLVLSLMAGGLGLAALAFIAIALVAILGDELLSDTDNGRRFRVGSTAAFVIAVLWSGIWSIWPYGVIVVGIWIGAAGWQKPKPPAEPSGE